MKHVDPLDLVDFPRFPKIDTGVGVISFSGAELGSVTYTVYSGSDSTGGLSVTAEIEGTELAISGALGAKEGAVLHLESGGSVEVCVSDIEISAGKFRSNLSVARLVG